ncbi:TonB-dependent receptor [Sphingorhabdus sp. EL138]|uniref:TonB-dependent receptor n=1 Tax=Sphingorhabdus sp. EL138 TaxID=2073156 RepID=UPI000D68BFD6|nr:TonB-dependent receptor [Sphingorhabdus sp. EL138]
MKMKYLLAASVVSLSTAGLLATPAAAQQTTSGFDGTVLDETGSPISGATVVITDTRTGAKRTLTTSSDGSFGASSLQTGGPYSVTTTAAGFEGQTVENAFINLSGETSLTFTLTSSADENIIIVSAQRANVTQLAIGPSQAFNQDVLESVPTINRDIRDVIRIDPRVSLSREQGGTVDRVTCLGANDRANTFTVDGIVQADTFGLNGTPFASRNSLPLPFDSIKETSVELAPFDVEYGQFTGCAINVVTKSGSNDFHGTAFFEYQDDGLTGDTAGGISAPPSSFNNKRWGATLSGPIVEDKLFFHVGYEQAEFSGVPVTDGPIGAGYPNVQEFIDVDTFNEIAGIIENTYGIAVGPLVRTNPERNERYFGRLDWFINDDHRLELSYQHLNEAKQFEDSLGSGVATGLQSFRVEGTKSDYFSGRLFSQWTDNFSTEIRLSRSEITDIQDPINGGEAQNGNPIPIIRVGVTTPFGCDTDAAGCETGFFEAGPGQFRSANDLQQTVDQFKVKGRLESGDHTFTLGIEGNRADVFNLFAINATGMFNFANVDALRAGLLNDGRSFNTFFGTDDLINGDTDGFLISASSTGDINDASASFKRSIFSIYAQDEWQATDQLNLLGGVRLDWYSGDAPRANPLFQQRYGFTNAVSFGSLDPVILPRLGFTYNMFNDGFFSNTQVKGGVGIFSGGDPTVWFSNAFSNDGFASAIGTLSSAECAGLTAGGQVDVTPGGGAFTGIPQCAVDAAVNAAQAGRASVQSTDPNLKIPTVLRANLGVATRFGTNDGGFFSNWGLNVDYIFSRNRNPFNFVDLTYAIDPNKGLNGFTIDGRPLYSSIDALNVGCDATFQGSGTTGGFVNVTDACFNTRREDEIQLTNAGSYNSHTVSAILSKNFDRGLFTDGGNVFVSLGYAWTDSNNRRDSSSSTATSNFTRTAAFDRQNPSVSTSNFEIRHNITFAANFEETLFDDYKTGLGFFFSAQSGLPYSVTFDGNPGFDEISSSRDAGLLYIPTGLNDPNVRFVDLVNRDTGAVLQTAADAASGLEDFISANKCISKYRGQTIPRNTCNNDWYYDLDIRLSQQIPGPGTLFGVDDRIEIYGVFDNFLNFIDSNGNARRNQTSDGRLDLVDGSVDSTTGQYLISGFNVGSDNEIDVLPSRWAIKVGVRYEF